MSVNGVAPSQNVPNSYDRDDLDVAPAPYIPNQDENIPDAGPTDAVTGSSSSISSRVKAGTKPPADRGPEYVGNTSPSDNAGDAMNNADAAASSLMNGLDGEDFITGPDGDYQTIDGTKLAWIMSFIARLTSLEMQMKMLTEAQGEMSQKLMEILLQLRPEEGDTSTDAARDAFFKSMKDRLKIIQQFMTSVYKAVYNHNFEIYNKRIQEMEKSKDRPWYEDTWNFVSGGSMDIDLARKERDETAKFNASIKENLHALTGALEALAAALESMGGLVNQGIAASLRQLNERIEQANVKLDQPIVQENCDYYDEDDAKDFLKNILTEIRSRMVATENTARAATYLQTAQMEQGQAIMEILLELSAHSSRAEYGYFAQEAVSKLSNMFFDATFNTLMARIQFYNQEVMIDKNIEKLEAAQGWRIAGNVAVLASIVVACATYGSTSYLTVALIGALGAGGAALQSYGTYAASQVPDSYDVTDPRFSLGVANTNGGEPKNVQEAINAAERAEEDLINSMAGSGLLVKGKDGFYAANAQALAMFDVKLKSLQNLSKMIALLHKAMRDLGRAVSATILGFAVKDFGDGYLLGNLDNSIQQRQLVMQAIKFQVQEEVTAKNIARQNQMMADKAFNSTGWGIAGMAAGFALSFIPGLNAFAGVFMSLGGALASTGYQIYDLQYSGYSSYHNDASELNTGELQRLLDQRNRNAVNSSVAEDKLTMYENALLANLLTYGYVGTGDGYHNVNFALVGKIYNALMKVQTLRQMLTSLREGQFKISAAVRQIVTGTGTVDMTSFGKIITQGSFGESLTLLQGITKFLGEKAKVMNRQRDAEKQMTLAVWTGAIASAVSVAAVSASVAGGTLGQMALAGATAVNSLASSAVNFIYEISWANSGFGEYEKYNNNSEQAIKDIKGKPAQPSDDPFDSLDALETQVYQEAGKNLARTLAGDNWVVDGEQTGILNSRLHAISNLRKMLSTLIEGKTSLSSLERRNLKAGGGQDVSNLMEFASDKERAAQNILNSLNEGMDVIVDRHNQMASAKRQAVLTALNVAVEVAIMVVASVAEDKRVDAQSTAVEANNASQAARQAVDPAAANAQAAQYAQTDTTKSASVSADNAGSAKVQAAPSAQPGQAAEVSNTPDKFDANGTRQRAEEMALKSNKLQDSWRHYQQVLTVLSATSAVMNYYLGQVYDARQGDVNPLNGSGSEKDASVKASGLDSNRHPSGSSAKGEVESSSRALSTGETGGDIFDTINALETDAETSDVLISKYSTQTPGEISAQMGEQFAKQWLEAIKQAAGGARYLSDKSAPAPYFKVDDANVKAAPSIDNARSGSDVLAKFHLGQNPQNPAQSIVDEFQAGKIEQEKALRVLEQMERIRPDLKDQIAVAKAAVASAKPQVAPVPDKPEIKAAEARKPGNTSNTLAYANQLIADFEEKNILAARQIKANVDGVKNAQAAADSFVLDGEQAARTPEEKLAALKLLRAELQQKMDLLNAAMKELTEKQLPAMKDQAAKLIGSCEDRAREIDKLLKPGAADLTAAEQAGLRAERKMLAEVEPQLTQKLKALKGQLEKIKGERLDVMSQMKGIQVQMARVTREKEQADHKVKTAAAASAKAATAKPQSQAVAGTAQVAYNKREESIQEKARKAEEDEARLASLVRNGRGFGGVQ